MSPNVTLGGGLKPVQNVSRIIWMDLRIGPFGKLGRFEPTAEIFIFTLLQSA
jgi:hypothetical protein